MSAAPITTNIKDTLQPYGYIYLITNTLNGKVYVGKTALPSTIEIRWRKHLILGRMIRRRREKNPNKKIRACHFLNALAKYDEKAWKVQKLDTATNKGELNEKEKYWIEKLNSIDPKIGYNSRTGGEGGKLRPGIRKRSVEKTRKTIKLMYQNDPEYRERVSKGIIKKYREDPDYREKHKKAMKEVGSRPEFKEKQRYNRHVTWERWKNDPEFREKYSKALSDGIKKDIGDKKEFLQSIKNGIPQSRLMKKYNIGCHKTIHRKIRDILGKHGVNNFMQAREFLKNKDLDKIMREIAI